MCSSLFRYTSEYKSNKKIAKRKKIFILEDCALSLGAKYNNTHTGLLGDAGVFSFYPVKHMTTAEGGMVITNNKSLSEKIKLKKLFELINHLMKGKFQEYMMQLN